MHSEKLLEHFKNPRNVGELGPGATNVEVVNPACGDILRLSATWKDGRVEEVRFLVRGCTAAIAAGSATTELLVGKTAAELAAMPLEVFEDALGGLKNETRHVAHLARDAARKLASF